MYFWRFCPLGIIEIPGASLSVSFFLCRFSQRLQLTVKMNHGLRLTETIILEPISHPHKFYLGTPSSYLTFFLHIITTTSITTHQFGIGGDLKIAFSLYTLLVPTGIKCI